MKKYYFAPCEPFYTMGWSWKEYDFNRKEG